MISIIKVSIFFVTLIKFKVLGGITLALVGGDCPLRVKEGAVVVVKK
jgi:hypothetical protein